MIAVESRALLVCAISCLTFASAIAAPGGPLTGFGTSGTRIISAITAADSQLLMTQVALQPDGSVVYAGHNFVEFVVVRFTSVGALPLLPETMAVASDGKLVVGGQQAIARILPAGVLDSSIGSGGLVGMPGSIWPRALAIDSQQRILAAGEFVFGGVPRRQRVTRVLANGSIDSNCGSSGLVEATLPAGYSMVDTIRAAVCHRAADQRAKP